MKNLISLRMEVRQSRVIALLMAIPILLIAIMWIGTLVLRILGYDLTPAEKKLRIGMSPEDVRFILGNPDTVATMDDDHGKPREDWWYSKVHEMQLTFAAGRLVSNHTKDHLRN